VKKLGGKVVGFASVVELVFLKGVDCIKKTHPEVDILILIQFEE
jgi:adenine/guanine phosphoribosyltransferase-like PRPP-binding protein